MSSKKIHAIINPASGQEQPVLAVLNRVFSQFDLDWSISVTQKEGDAQQQTNDARSAGVDVVAVYGGDGTVGAVASALVETDTPLAILPGGTANVFSQELSIPQDLEAAVYLACGKDAKVRAIDVGQVNEHYFLLRVGLGFEAQMIADADRDLKNRLGFFAYLLSAAQNAVALQPAIYQVTLDGEELEVEAITCSVVNSGRMGIGLSISPSIRVDDGLLDFIAIRQADLPTITQILSNVTGLSPAIGSESKDVLLRFVESKSFLHRTAKEITIHAKPSQMMQYDGELLQDKEIVCRVLPQALNVLAPV